MDFAGTFVLFDFPLFFWSFCKFLAGSFQVFSAILGLVDEIRHFRFTVTVSSM